MLILIPKLLVHSGAQNHLNQWNQYSLSYNVIQVLYIEYKPDKEGTSFFFQLIYRVPGGIHKEILHPDDIPEELLDKMIDHLMSNLLTQKEHDKRNN